MLDNIMHQQRIEKAKNNATVEEDRRAKTQGALKMALGAIQSSGVLGDSPEVGSAMPMIEEALPMLSDSLSSNFLVGKLIDKVSGPKAELKMARVTFDAKTDRVRQEDSLMEKVIVHCWVACKWYMLQIQQDDSRKFSKIDPCVRAMIQYVRPFGIKGTQVTQSANETLETQTTLTLALPGGSTLKQRGEKIDIRGGQDVKTIKELNTELMKDGIKREPVFVSLMDKGGSFKQMLPAPFLTKHHYKFNNTNQDVLRYILARIEMDRKVESRGGVGTNPACPSAAIRTTYGNILADAGAAQNVQCLPTVCDETSYSQTELPGSDVIRELEQNQKRNPSKEELLVEKGIIETIRLISDKTDDMDEDSFRETIKGVVDTVRFNIAPFDVYTHLFTYFYAVAPGLDEAQRVKLKAYTGAIFKVMQPSQLVAVLMYKYYRLRDAIPGTSNRREELRGVLLLTLLLRSSCMLFETNVFERIGSDTMASNSHANRILSLVGKFVKKVGILTEVVEPEYGVTIIPVGKKKKTQKTLNINKHGLLLPGNMLMMDHDQLMYVHTTRFTTKSKTKPPPELHITLNDDRDDLGTSPEMMGLLMETSLSSREHKLTGILFCETGTEYEIIRINDSTVKQRTLQTIPSDMFETLMFNWEVEKTATADPGKEYMKATEDINLYRSYSIIQIYEDIWKKTLTPQPTKTTTSAHTNDEQLSIFEKLKKYAEPATTRIRKLKEYVGGSIETEENIEVEKRIEVEEKIEVEKKIEETKERQQKLVDVEREKHDAKDNLNSLKQIHKKYIDDSTTPVNDVMTEKEKTSAVEIKWTDSDKELVDLRIWHKEVVYKLKPASPFTIGFPIMNRARDETRDIQGRFTFDRPRMAHATESGPISIPDPLLSLFPG